MSRINYEELREAGKDSEWDLQSISVEEYNRVKLYSLEMALNVLKRHRQKSHKRAFRTRKGPLKLPKSGEMLQAQVKRENDETCYFPEYCSPQIWPCEDCWQRYPGLIFTHDKGAITVVGRVTNLAIVGSREFNDYEYMKLVIEDWMGRNGKPDLIVSGGARGADTLAERWADENDVPTRIFKPQYDNYGKAAPMKRNTTIVEHATHVLAFPLVGGRGTQDTIRKAKQRNVPVEEHPFQL